MSFDVLWEDSRYSDSFKVIQVSETRYSAAKDMGEWGWLVYKHTNDIEVAIEYAKEANFKDAQLELKFNEE